MEEVIVNTNNQNKFEQSKFMQVFNKFVYSDCFFIALVLIISICWWQKWLFAGLSILVVLASILFVIKRDILPACSILLLITSVISVRKIPSNIMDLWPLVVLLVISILAHIIIYPMKSLKLGRMTMPLLAVLVACLLGGIGSQLEHVIKADIINALWLGGIPLVIYFLVLNYESIPENVSFAQYVAKLIFYFGCIVVLEIAIYYISNWDFVMENPLSVVHLGWGVSNTVATVLLLSFPMGFYLYYTSKGPKSYLYILMSITHFIGIASTTSRGALIVGSVEFVILVIATIFVCKDKKRKEYLIMSAIILAVALFIIVLEKNAIIKIFYIIFVDGMADSGRFRIYTEAIACFLQSPMFGAGLGYIGDWEAIIDQKGLYQIHNTILQILACTGIIGAIAYLFYYAERIKMLFDKWDAFNLFVFLASFGFEGYSMLNTGTIQAFPFLAIIMVLTIAVEKNTKLTEYNYIKKLFFKKNKEGCLNGNNG